MKLALALLLLSVACFAQGATHSVTVAWVDTLNPTGTTYNIYRATGLCSGSPVFSKIASAIGPKTYSDTTISVGNYCYTVTATFQGMESAPGNTALAPVPSFSPTNITVTVQ